ncbi:MAG: undecaprenyl-diphosphate phosphatase [Eubacteriales bacterium]|nr:undecaprenyl-diphosphate phosphatase [Eubacteriales bacterium]
MLIELLKSVVFGIVQGITEWLPISSTGHLLLFNEFLQLDGSKDFSDMFFTVIQFGSILAVLFLYFDKLNPFSGKKSALQKKETWTLWVKVIVASFPAAIIGLVFNDFIHDLLYGPVTIAIMLILYGILFIILENSHRVPKIRSLSEMKFQTAFLIGICQMLALIPGTSRSGATILGAVFIGCSRAVAAEFSFFMAIPVMFGASLLEILKYGLAFRFQEIIVLLVGMVVAFAVSMLAIKFLMSYIRKHDFKVFGWYRIVLGIVVLLVFAFLA